MLNKKNKERIWFIDEVRGFCILCMVVYHAAFDLIYINRIIEIPFFHSGAMNIVRDIFVMIFVLISGTASQLSRNNIRRGIICLIFAAGISIATFAAGPEYVVKFGIIHMLGACMLIYGLTQNILNRIKPFVGLILFFSFFAFTYGMAKGYVGFFGFYKVILPQFLYESEFLFPIGLPNPEFSSGDYFPLIPWFLLFVCGSYFGVYAKNKMLPGVFYKKHLNWLAFVGRNTLIIYILHQPVLMLVFWILARTGII